VCGGGLGGGSWRESFNARTNAAVAAATQETARGLLVTIAELQLENDKLRETVHTQESMREEMQTNMKQAFMRGVCALNIEAMSVMSASVPSDAAPLVRVHCSPRPSLVDCRPQIRKPGLKVA
jgi:hypothetical protein